jgi:hypothetical protein
MTHHAHPETLESIAKEFDSIDAYLQAFHETMQEGHLPNIADLDDRIAHLCSRVESAPEKVQEPCLAKLNGLLKKLDNCESEMTSFHAALVQRAAP